MKYALFSGNDYYPDGGWSDFRGFFSDVQEAIQKGKSSLGCVEGEGGLGSVTTKWFHVVDISTGKIVARTGENEHGNNCTPESENVIVISQEDVDTLYSSNIWFEK